MDAELKTYLDRMTDTIGHHFEVIEARLGERIDRVEQRLDRVEHRLDAMDVRFAEKFIHIEQFETRLLAELAGMRQEMGLNDRLSELAA